MARPKKAESIRRTNLLTSVNLPITQPASIERCNGDGGEQFAIPSVVAQAGQRSLCTSQL